MSDIVTAALIASIPPTVVAGVALFQAFRVGRAVQVVHLTMNSRLDQLVALTAKSSHAAGVKEEKDRKAL